MAVSELLISERLTVLRQKLEAGNSDALDTFWQEVAEDGTPLLESIPGDSTHMFVTFLWKAINPIHNVVIVGGLAGRGFDVMTRLLDTNVWYKTYRAHKDTFTLYHLTPNDTLVPYDEDTDFDARVARWEADPLNPHIDTFWGMSGGSILALPGASLPKWCTSYDAVPTGRLEAHRLGNETLNAERDIWVYIPHDQNPTGEAYHLLILFDGWEYTNAVPTPTILDNLIADGRIPPSIAVFIGHNNRFQELSCSPSFMNVLVEEVLPWVHQNYAATKDPARIVIGGSSLGGLTAVYAGLQHPDLFGNILAMSGAFHWKPDDDEEYEWMARQFVTSPVLPLRFYISVGKLEGKAPFMDDPDFLVTNRHLRNILHAKHYSAQYSEYNSCHDYAHWRYALAEGLMALIGKR